MLKESNLGFTLIELLIVLLIGVFLVSLATPRAAKLFDGFSAQLNALYWENLSKQAGYESFVRQTSCIIMEEEAVAEGGEIEINLICGKAIVSRKKLDVSGKSSLDSLFEGGLPLSFSPKGLLLSVTLADMADSK